MKNSFLSALMLIALSTCTMSAKAETLTVTPNSNSGISLANYTGTLSDGSILGFDRSGSYVYFCGAISTASSLEIMDSISISGSMYAVKYCGYSSNLNLDFDEATSVSSLTLPPTITQIYSVPSSISDLHLKSTTPPSLYSSSSISISTTILVPQSVLTSYQNVVLNRYSEWYMKVVHYEGWEPKSYTINVQAPGTFAQVLLGVIDQWTDVDELTVSGNLNESDLAYLSRLKSMTKLDLSQTNITTITGCAGLYYLKTILLPSSVKSVAKEAFKNCSSLREISLPNTLEIGEDAFYYCSSLSTVSLPAATNIGSNAFYYCSSLSTVSLPAVTNIGSYAFSTCYSLSTVSLPAATNIGSNAFYYCYSLSTVSLPNTLRSLGDNAFDGCENLTDVYCYAISPLTTTAFSSTGASMTTLHVPAFAVSAYILHDNWYSFYKIVPIEETIDNLIISSDFTITDYTGLAEKPDLSVIADVDYSDDFLGYTNISNHHEGHLNVSASSNWVLGDYVQSQTNLIEYYMDNNYSRFYSTLIPYNEITADNVTVKYWPYKNQWNFFTLPFDVNVSDIIAPEGSLWVIRRYSGDDRAKLTGNTWQNMTNGMTLKAGEGYILHYNSETSNTKDWFIFKAVNNANKNNIFACQDVTKQLSTYTSDLARNRNWNLVGNPYPCFYDTRNIEHNGVITVWDGYGYKAYSLLDDNYVLHPNEAFFVQCPDDATSMKFKKEGRQHTYEAMNSASYAKSTRAASAINRQVFNLTLSGAEYTDRTRIVINESAKLDYEISCDASKFMSSNVAVPQIYILENGQKMAIDERPLSNGTIALGMYIGETGDYTIGMSAAPTDVILIDNATGKTVNINSETYTFSAAKGTIDNRFTILIGDATGIEDNATGESKQPKTYNINGQKLSLPQKGINIINGKKTIVR